MAGGDSSTLRVVTRVALAAMLQVTLMACDGSGPGLSQLSAVLKPRRERFARFERWARQLQSSDVASRSRAALAEATFAPIRGDADVLFAHVAVEGDEQRTLVLPEPPALPSQLSDVLIRDQVLGDVRVALLNTCPFGRAAKRPRPTACVVVSRRAPTNTGALLLVRVAFELPKP